ncbi:HNH endonuclease, partial [Listeria monocytogenes]|nr:HNH endonuclease [Listeria monocytogenes]EAE6669400.1 HNH endonuclease [Listeria monocytogenes]EAG7129845.1 HNH endonuclease [Listeria monocytogenes]EGS4796525.1 HNH endonuclease [Listeria monocytogenes]HEM2026375.1 HNH endonuclease [Listeria monocytogenes]
EIRKKITTQFEAIIFIDDLVRLSEVYGGMKNPAEDNFFETDSQQVLNDLKRLGAKSFYPIILAMVKKDYGPNEIYEVLSAIEVLVVRNFVISGLVANKYETEFSKIAFKIYQEEVESVTEIINLIRTNIIADDVFLNNFSSFKTTNKLRLRYILKKINDSYSKEIAVLNDNNKIHLEHIMPIKADGWDIIKEEHEEYLWKIGNLTLLGSEYNKKSTNKIFNDKKDIYEYSEVQLTRKLLDYDEWNIDVIKERQVELAELAVNIWKV